MALETAVNVRKSEGKGREGVSKRERDLHFLDEALKHLGEVENC